eukprot:6701356-Pyramimonas_sp.AAC.1
MVALVAHLPAGNRQLQTRCQGHALDSLPLPIRKGLAPRHVDAPPGAGAAVLRARLRQTTSSARGSVGLASAL